MDIIVGTAGHIDHGKTALVKALTGKDADRLPEEKERGITIDLGFADLHLGDVKIGFVDVPGHEKFVKNMLAGASGIDLVLLVIAADEGVMPQTKEHFEICRLLDTKYGLIVLTKTDLVNEEFLELVKLDVAELVENSFLENAAIVTVSAKTGEGIDELKEALTKTASQIPARKNEIIARLPIDRAFTVKGFGAVITGTLATGEIVAGSEMELLPFGGKVRVRGIQTHGNDVGKAKAGQRTAVNLGGIDQTEIERGMVLSEPGTLRSGQVFDAEVEVLEHAKRSLKTRQRVRVHLGTIEALARIQVLNTANEIMRGEKDFAQIRFESPIIAIPGERFILRQYSPQITIAGGQVLDGHAKKHRKKEIGSIRRYLQSLKEADLENDNAKAINLFLEVAGETGLNFSDLQARTGWQKQTLQNALDETVNKRSIIKSESFYVARTPYEDLKSRVLGEIKNHHKIDPLSRGILRETLREKTSAHISLEIFKAALIGLENEAEVSIERDIVKASSHDQELTKEETTIRENLLLIYENSGLQAPSLKSVLSESTKSTKLSPTHARKIFQLLLNSNDILKVTEDLYFSQKAVMSLVKKLKDFAEENADNRFIAVSEFKDLAGVSRKYAIPLLEYFDLEKITRRAGDKRLIL